MENKKPKKNITNEEAWEYAIGMIKVDGLEPSEEFKELMEREKRGEITTDDMLKALDRKYKMKEADKEVTEGSDNHA